MNRRALLTEAGVLCLAVVLALAGSRSYAADPGPVTVLVTYHSSTGNTEKMAQGVADGAKAVLGTSVILKALREVVWVNSGTSGYGRTVRAPAACR
jgi:hypothetical protein